MAINEEKINELLGRFLNDFGGTLSFRDGGDRRQTGLVQSAWQTPARSPQKNWPNARVPMKGMYASGSHLKPPAGMCSYDPVHGPILPDRRAGVCAHR